MTHCSMKSESSAGRFIFQLVKKMSCAVSAGSKNATVQVIVSPRHIAVVRLGANGAKLVVQTAHVEEHFASAKDHASYCTGGRKIGDYARSTSFQTNFCNSSTIQYAMCENCS